MKGSKMDNCQTAIPNPIEIGVSLNLKREKITAFLQPVGRRMGQLLTEKYEMR